MSHESMGLPPQEQNGEQLSGLTTKMNESTSNSMEEKIYNKANEDMSIPKEIKDTILTIAHAREMQENSDIQSSAKGMRDALYTWENSDTSKEEKVQALSTLITTLREHFGTKEEMLEGVDTAQTTEDREVIENNVIEREAMIKLLEMKREWNEKDEETVKKEELIKKIQDSTR